MGDEREGELCSKQRASSLGVGLDLGRCELVKTMGDGREGEICCR